VDVNALRQQMIKELGSMAVGAGGSPDVFTAELNKELAQGVAMAAPDPAAARVTPDVPDSDQPDSDQPDPAAGDLQP
jgi:hypothetical protein